MARASSSNLIGIKGLKFKRRTQKKIRLEEWSGKRKDWCTPVFQLSI